MEQKHRALPWFERMLRAAISADPTESIDIGSPQVSLIDAVVRFISK